MASGKTARRLLPFPKPEDADKICADLQALAEALDNDAPTAAGKISARPAAALRGKLYMVEGDATAFKNGVLWWDSGTGWVAVPSLTGEQYVVETRVESVAFEPSASEAAIVVAKVEAAGAQATAKVLCGATEIAEIVAPAGTTGTASVIIPAGKTCTIATVTGAPTSLKTATLLLGLKRS